MKTVLEVLEAMKEYFHRRHLTPERVFAEEVLCAALNIKRLQLYLEHDRPLTEAELETCRVYLRRRGKREPIQYIEGEVEFYHCKLEVSPAVLIPRPETEQLVDRIASELAGCDLKNQELWDICTGSGCIGIALKKRFPDLQVTLSDLSSESLDVAKKNALKNQVEVKILQGDLLEPYKGKKCHYLVSNPPYVSRSDYPLLQPEVRDYEPKYALVGGELGFDFYKRFSQELIPSLHSNAKIWFEIGSDQGRDLENLFQNDYWKSKKVEKDYAGLDRFFSCSFSYVKPN